MNFDVCRLSVQDLQNEIRMKMSKSPLYLTVELFGKLSGLSSGKATGNLEYYYHELSSTTR